MMDQVALTNELVALSERVAAIEQHLVSLTTPDKVRTTVERDITGDETDDFWALSGLATRLKDHPATEQGVVMLVGALHLSDGPISWQQTMPTGGMLESDWSDFAAAFSALGHPVRLELLRHVLNGTHSTADLADLEDLGTTGQLHHHLRQLVTSGWVRQSGRGQYEVPAQRVVPLLACLVGAER